MAIRNKEGIQLKRNEICQSNQSNQLILYINKIEELNNDVTDFFDTLAYINKNFCGEIFNKWYYSHKGKISYVNSDDSLSGKSVAIMCGASNDHDIAIYYYPENNGFKIISIKNLTLKSYAFNEQNYKMLYYLLEKDQRYIDFIVERFKEFYEKLKIFLNDFFKWVDDTFKTE